MPKDDETVPPIPVHTDPELLRVLNKMNNTLHDVIGALKGDEFGNDGIITKMDKQRDTFVAHTIEDLKQFERSADRQNKLSLKFNYYVGGGVGIMVAIELFRFMQGR